MVAWRVGIRRTSMGALSRDVTSRPSRLTSEVDGSFRPAGFVVPQATVSSLLWCKTLQGGLFCSHLSVWDCQDMHRIDARKL